MNSLVKQNSENIDLSGSNELNNSLNIVDESNDKIAKLKIELAKEKDKNLLHKEVVKYHLGDNNALKCNNFYVKWSIRNYKATEQMTKIIPAKEARQTKSLKILKI